MQARPSRAGVPDRGGEADPPAADAPIAGNFSSGDATEHARGLSGTGAERREAGSPVEGSAASRAVDQTVESALPLETVMAAVAHLERTGGAHGTASGTAADDGSNDEDPKTGHEVQAALEDQVRAAAPAISSAVVTSLVDLDAAVEWFVYRRNGRAGFGPAQNALTLDDVRLTLLQVVATPGLVSSGTPLDSPDSGTKGSIERLGRIALAAIPREGQGYVAGSPTSRESSKTHNAAVLAAALAHRVQLKTTARASQPQNSVIEPKQPTMQRTQPESASDGTGEGGKSGYGAADRAALLHGDPDPASHSAGSSVEDARENWAVLEGEFEATCRRVLMGLRLAGAAHDGSNSP